MRALLVAFVALVLVACGDDTGVPLPVADGGSDAGADVFGGDVSLTCYDELPPWSVTAGTVDCGDGQFVPPADGTDWIGGCLWGCPWNGVEYVCAHGYLLAVGVDEALVRISDCGSGTETVERIDLVDGQPSQE